MRAWGLFVGTVVWLGVAATAHATIEVDVTDDVHLKLTGTEILAGYDDEIHVYKQVVNNLDKLIIEVPTGIQPKDNVNGSLERPGDLTGSCTIVGTNKLSCQTAADQYNKGVNGMQLVISARGGHNTLQGQNDGSDVAYVAGLTSISFSGSAGCDEVRVGVNTNSTVDVGDGDCSGGPQIIRTLAGNDKAILGNGPDDVDLGDDFDQLDADQTSTGMTITIDDQFNDGGGGDRIRGVESFTLTTHDDVFNSPTQAIGLFELIFREGNDTLNGNAWAERAVHGGPGVDTFNGNGGGDQLFGDEDGDVIHGGDADDDLHGGAGNDQITGDSGNDILQGDADVDTLDGGDGNDAITDDAGTNTILGGPGNDAIGGGTTIDGGTGNDTITASLASAMVGGEGDDDLTGTAAHDDLDGGPGADKHKGGGGNDTIGAGDGDDPVVDGGPGDDTISAGAGNDTVTGGDGNDPQVNGDDGDDSLDGGTGNDALDGGNGTDLITPGDGNDQARGGAGDDIFVHGKGGDLVDGGEGTLDAFNYFDQPVVVSIDGAANDGESNGAEGDNVVSIERLGGSTKNDTLTGSGAIEYIGGGDGDDAIDGGGAVDVLRGGWGNDTITGRDGLLERDDVGCNDGAGDKAILDVNDVVASDCETVDRASAPPGVDPGALGPNGIGPGTALGGPAAPGASTGAPGARAPDTTPAKLSLKGVPGKTTRAKLARGLSISVSSNEPVTLDARIVATTRRVTYALNDNLTLARATAGRAGGTRRLKLKPRRSRLGGARKLKVLVVAIDAGGNRTTISRTFKVTR